MVGPHILNGFIEIKNEYQDETDQSRKDSLKKEVLTYTPSVIYDTVEVEILREVYHNDRTQHMMDLIKDKLKEKGVPEERIEVNAYRDEWWEGLEPDNKGYLVAYRIK